MRPRFGVTVVACLLAVATGVGCGDDDSGSSSSDSSGSSKAFTPQPKSGVQGGLLPSELKLWKYDTSAGKFQVVSGDASKPYQPHDDKAPKPYTFAFAEGWAANPFSVSIHKGVYKFAKQMGINIIYCDNQFKTDVAISCAEQLAAQKPDFAIESNWQSGVAKQVMAIWDKAKIPAANVDVWHPNGIFFGANNYDSGVIGGKAAGQYAKKQWGCKEVWLFLGEHLEEGEAADLRLQGFADGVQEVCGELPSGNIDRLVMDAGTADQAITKTTDWITAHPQAKHVLATSIDDERATGIAKALVASRTDGVALGPGCDQVGIAAVKSAPTSENKYLGCVAFYPERYPDYLMSIGLDVLAGKPVPQEVHIVHKFLNHDTIGQAYP
jgi:ribose transport system substrate-binding protein